MPVRVMQSQPSRAIHAANIGCMQHCKAIGSSPSGVSFFVATSLDTMVMAGCRRGQSCN